MEDRWLIWSNEHKAWWAPGRNGYTLFAKLAGRYSFDEACQICRNANQFLKKEPHETMVNESNMG